MNHGDAAHGHERDDWTEFDDTLADGPAPAGVPDDARPWLAEQRTLHGLLRALHTADAAARESRVAAIMARVDAEPRRGAGAGRRWILVAAAALLLASLGLWFALPARLPTAEAAVQRAVVELARDVDRRFRLEVVGTGRNGDEVLRHEFELVTRPGMRFRLDGTFGFGGLRLGQARIGCDGEEVWVLPVNGIGRRAGPLAERERLLRGLGDVLDVGYLDVHELMQRLPEDCDVRLVGREAGADGRSLLRVEAGRKRRSLLVRTRSAELLFDERSGMVVSLEAEVQFTGGATRRLSIEYLGELPAGSVDYRRPW